MGTNDARLLRRPRPLWRSYLLLARVSNLPTVWTNVIAGTVLAAGSLDWRHVALMSAAVSLLYVAGMILNDAFDHRIDATGRPDRPLPAGDVSVGGAFATGAVLLAAGVLLLVWITPHRSALLFGVLLAAAILYYDYRHKRDRFGPVVMGLCRGLVYCVAAAAAGGVSPVVLIAAAVMTVYVIGLTQVAKRIGARRGYLVPYLVAGISIVDALAVATVMPRIAPLVALGFPLTIAGQRVIPGD